MQPEDRGNDDISRNLVFTNNPDRGNSDKQHHRRRIMTLAIPWINNNGNPRQELIDDLIAVRDRIHEAMGLLQASDYIHGRNYIGVDPEVYAQAKKQHRERMNQLQTVCTDLMQIAFAIDEQGKMLDRDMGKGGSHEFSG